MALHEDVLWLADTFANFSRATAEWILTKLDRKQFCPSVSDIGPVFKKGVFSMQNIIAHMRIVLGESI